MKIYSVINNLSVGTKTQMQSEVISQHVSQCIKLKMAPNSDGMLQAKLAMCRNKITFKTVDFVRQVWLLIVLLTKQLAQVLLMLLLITIRSIHRMLVTQQIQQNFAKFISIPMVLVKHG